LPLLLPPLLLLLPPPLLPLLPPPLLLLLGWRATQGLHAAPAEELAVSPVLEEKHSPLGASEDLRREVYIILE